MAKAERLKNEARESAAFRGHKMGAFKQTSEKSWIATCQVCGAKAGVDINPPPNGAEIWGDAVAVHCPGKEVH